jgi:hypothetical protein
MEEENVFDVSLFKLYYKGELALGLRAIILILILILILARVTLHLRIANWVGEDSYCRGGIVNIRFGFPRALLERRPRPTALWRFRASTSNSLSGRSRLHARTHIRHIYQTYAQQDIRVYEDDHFEPPLWQS